LIFHIIHIRIIEESKQLEEVTWATIESKPELQKKQKLTPLVRILFTKCATMKTAFERQQA
jgi:hypothetical protein